MLSLEDAVSLGLENNLAIAVEQYVPWLDQANLLLARSGANGKTQFDPTITGTLSLAQTTTTINNPFLAELGLYPPAQPLKRRPRRRSSATLSRQILSTLRDSQRVRRPKLRSTINAPRAAFRSTYSTQLNRSTLTIQVTQPLLNGFGRHCDNVTSSKAKTQLRSGESQFAQQVISLR